MVYFPPWLFGYGPKTAVVNTAMAAAKAMGKFKKGPGLRGTAARYASAAKMLRRSKPRRAGFLNKGRYARVGGHASFSKFSLFSKPSKRISAMKKVGAPNQTLTNNTLRISPDEGYQIPG